MKTHKCALDAHHRHMCALPKDLIVCISLFGECQTLTFEKSDHGPYQTTKYRICGFLGVREYASGGRINNFSDLCIETYFSHLALLPSLEPYVRLRGENAISEVSVWLTFVCRNLVIPRGLLMTTTTNTER